MGARLFPLRSFSNSRPHSEAPTGLIWITNVFRFSVVHRFWSVEEFWDPLKPGDNDFHPQGHHRGPPSYWPLRCRPALTSTFLHPSSDQFNKEPKKPKKLLGSMSLFSPSLFYSSPPCSGSSRGLSKTIHFCHVAKSFWHPFSMLIWGQLWIFNMFPGASERQKEDLEWQIIERVCPGKTETKTDKSTKTYVHVSEQERNKST